MLCCCGKYDGFWELWLQPFDVLYGVVLVEEAGGKVKIVVAIVIIYMVIVLHQLLISTGYTK